MRSRTERFGSLLFVWFLPACGPGHVASSGSETSSSTEESGSSESGSSESETEESESEESETDEGSDDTSPPLADNPCWVESRTGYHYLQQFVGGPEHLFAISDDGLLVENGGEWSYDISLAMSPDDMWGTPDDLWLLDAGKLHHWDGQNLELVLEGLVASQLVPTPMGAVWLAHEDEGVALLELEPGGDQWDPHVGPDFDHFHSFAATSNERWVMSREVSTTRFAHQVGEGPWLIEEPVLPDFSLDPTMLLGDDGTLWIATADGCDEPAHLIRRSLAGEWTWVEVEPTPGDACGVTAVESGGELYALRRSSTMVWRWDGVGDPEPVLELPIEAHALFGEGGRVLAYDNRFGPTIIEITPELVPSAEVLFDREVVRSGVASATTLDAVFGGSSTSIHRWDGDAWSIEFDGGGGNPLGVIGVWADGPDSAWLTELHYLAFQFSTRIWRSEAGASSMVEELVDIELGPVWGRAPDQVWAVGHDGEQNAALWFFDGSSWAASDAPEASPTLVGVTGDSQHLFVIDRLGVVYEREGDGWTALPSLDVSLDRVFLAMAGGELLVAYTHTINPDPWDPGPQEDRFEVWDGQAWHDAQDRWPDAPELARRLSTDGLGGVWAMTPSEPPELHYLHSDDWEQVDTPSDLDHGGIAAAPEGVVVHESPGGGQHTREFRWNCE